MKSKVIKYPRYPKKGVFVRKFIFALLVISLVVFFSLLWGQTSSYQQIKEEADILEASLEGIHAENELLKKEISLLQEQDYIEIQARKQLGMVRPGEIIFFVGD